MREWMSTTDLRDGYMGSRKSAIQGMRERFFTRSAAKWALKGGEVENTAARPRAGTSSAARAAAMRLHVKPTSPGRRVLRTMRSACQESVVRGESRGMSRRKTISGRSSACGLAVMTRGVMPNSGSYR